MSGTTESKNSALTWGQARCPNWDPNEALTDNALVSSRKRLPSRATVGVEPGSAHVGPAMDKRGHTHAGKLYGNTLAVFPGKNPERKDFGTTNKPKLHFKFLGLGAQTWK